MTGFEWTAILADLRQKRDAIANFIDVILTNFVQEQAPEARQPQKRQKVRKVAATRKPGQVRKLREPQPRAATSGTGSASVDLVQARDAAILARLKKGHATASECRDAMTAEPGKTDGQRNSDCYNALTRLRLRKQVKQVDDGWALA